MNQDPANFQDALSGRPDLLDWVKKLDHFFRCRAADIALIMHASSCRE